MSPKFFSAVQKISLSVWMNLTHERRKFGLYAALPIYGIIMSSMALVGSFPLKLIGVFLNPGANILIGIIVMSTHLTIGWSSLSSYMVMVLLFCTSIAVNLLFWLLVAYKINKYLDSRKRLGLPTSKRVKIGLCPMNRHEKCHI